MMAQSRSTIIKTVTLSGCGWLGQPLAKSLMAHGAQVFGTTTRSSQLDILNQQGIQARLFSLNTAQPNAQHYSASLCTAFTQSQTLVINIPPGRRHINAEPFIASIQHLINKAVSLQPTLQIIFISTTSVFGALTGIVDEDTPTAPNTASGAAHAILEQWCLDKYPKQACVVRLAGLIDAHRHPITALINREQIQHGQQVVNLVHQTDVVNALTALIKHSVDEVAGKIFHLCAPEHPTRAEYYQAAAQHKQLGRVDFVPSDSVASQGKIVHAQKTQQQLGFEYLYTSPYDML